MLLGLFDRLWTPTIIHSALALAIYTLRHVASDRPLYALLLANGAYYAKLAVTAITEEHKIDALGKRAPSRRTWTPWNIGMLFSAVWYFSRHRNHEWWDSMFELWGNKNMPYTVESVIIGGRMIFTADEEVQYQGSVTCSYTDFIAGIFTTDGDQWHASRGLLRPQFIKDRVSDLQTFEKHTQVLIRLLAGSHNGATVRADDLFYRYTLDAATDFLLGKSVQSLENGETEFAQAFADVQNTQSYIARLGPVRWLIPMEKFRRGLKVINRFVGAYIDRALQLPPDELEKITKSDEGYTFLHALASYTRDRDILRDQLVAVLLAGRDTTAVTLSWLFYELSRAPQVVEKLRDEIMTFVGPEQQPTYDNLKSMRYLQHTLNEILRLYPVVPYNVRVALRDTTLPHGGGANGDEPIGILKDTPIGYSTLILQRRSDIYPPQASGFPDYLKFVPERWDGWTPKSWTYIPFNGGPRICIGQQFALTELAYTLVRILQTFERVECRMDEFPMLKTDIVLQPALGVDIAFLRSEKQ
ncbi:hypothetical protein LTR53_013282 [Teratosphaeriaceae sp. CCFEE 6253]|nr:hypothetical protein LTR53_013282 [Teratosphaeriaceae sp. CCFEE 6253]